MFDDVGLLTDIIEHIRFVLSADLQTQRPAALATGLINFLSITDHLELDHVVGMRIVKIVFGKRRSIIYHYLHFYFGGLGPLLHY